MGELQMLSWSVWIVCLTLVQIESGYTQSTVSPLFQCQASSEQNGQVLTPNIPDFYFNHESAATLSNGGDVTTARAGITHIFTIPPLSPDRNCSGTVTAFQYCYRAEGEDSNARSAFKYLSMTVDEEGIFTVERILDVETTPLSETCSTVEMSQSRICCATTPLLSSNQFQIASSNHTFGITVGSSNTTLLTFASSVPDYEIEQFQITLSPRRLTVGRRFLISENPPTSSFPLLKFHIEPDETLGGTVPTAVTTIPTPSATDATTPEVSTQTTTPGGPGATNCDFTTTLPPRSDYTICTASIWIIGGTAAALVASVVLNIILLLLLLTRLRSHRKTSVHLLATSNTYNEEKFYATANIPVITNESYGTTTRKVDPEQIYATVDDDGYEPMKPAGSIQ